MKAEQVGVNKIKISLDSELERVTLGSADKIELIIEKSTCIGYQSSGEIKSVEVSRDE
jgi:hypothetical protein